MKVTNRVKANRPILVAQASGKTGRAIVKALVRRGAQAHAIVRREAARAELEAIGASHVTVGDLFEEATLALAMEAAGTVLLISPPMHPLEARLVDNAITLARGTGVERLVYYSVLHPLLSDVPHHARKLEAERALADSGFPHTILQPGRYMQQLNSIWKQVVADGVHAMPFSTAAPFALVDMLDLAEATARVLGEAGHGFATYQLAGPDLLSQDDAARILSALLEKPVRAVAKPLEQALLEAKAAGLPDVRIDTIARMNAHYDAHGLAGNGNVLTWLLGRPPTTFAAFVQRDFLSGVGGGDQRS